MEFFTWKKEYSVNSTIIDEQHRSLVGIINKLYEAFYKNIHKEKLGEILNELREYSVYHFSTEKKYLKQDFGFDLSQKHLDEHKEFIKKLNDFSLKYVKNRSELTYEIILFLRNWLINHILKTDREYKNCFLQE